MFSSMRMIGLASGLDINSMVTDIMRAHRIPVQRLEQDKQILEWQQQDYRDINMALRSFRDTAFNMRLQSTYLAKNTFSSNEGVLTASAGSNAYPGSYKVEVTQLAEGVFKGSQVELPGVRDEDTPLKTLSEQFVELENFEIEETITFTLKGSKGEQEFKINPAVMNVFDVVNMINQADLGIRANYDLDQNRFFLSTEATGESEFIEVIEDSHVFLSDILMLDLKTGDQCKGKNAKLNFGDITGLTSATNRVTVNGISLELKSTGESTINITNDTDAVFNSIKSFVEDYNKIMQTINDKLREPLYRDYRPLTDEQRQQLTDDQIDSWMEKARSGHLRNDPVLSGIYSKLRMTINGVLSGVGGRIDRLSQIGITTTANYMSAELQINETKLREAIEKDPQGIIDLFTKDSESDNEKGIARRLYNVVDGAMKTISTRAGNHNDFSLVDDSDIGERIKRVNEEIARRETRLAQLEDRYWRQFTAMEKAINQMNQQSMWLSQQFMQMG